MMIPVAAPAANDPAAISRIVSVIYGKPKLQAIRVRFAAAPPEGWLWWICSGAGFRGAAASTPEAAYRAWERRMRDGLRGVE